MKTQKTVTASMLAAIICIATMVIKIPSPFRGYLNLGDCAVLAAGWMMSPLYAFLAAGIGSGLADAFSGYAIYAPATFVIKGVMALAACFGLGKLKGIGDTSAYILSGIIAEIIMILGYFLFEGVMYGFVQSAVNIPANALQGVAGSVIGAVMTKRIKIRF